MIHPQKKVCASAHVPCAHVLRARVPCVRLLLVLVCRIMYHIRTYLVSARLYLVPDTYVPGLHPKNKKNRTPSTLRERHTRTARHTMHSNVRVTTAASETEGVAAVSWIESLMIRRPFGSIDPNSIRETELHTECRRRRERESLNSPRRDRERDAARQRAAATRMREIDEERAERCVFHCLRCQQPYTLGAAAK